MTRLQFHELAADEAHDYHFDNLHFSSLQGNIGRNLERLYNQQDSLRALVVVRDDVPLGSVVWSASDTEARFFDRPARIEVVDDCPFPILNEVVESLLERFTALNSGKRCDFLIPSEALNSIRLSRKILGNQFQLELTVSGEINLDAIDEQLIWLRKSYRPIVRKDLLRRSLSHLTSRNYSNGELDRFREFHREVAGRVTRPLSTWEEMGQAIQEGRAEATFTYDEGVLISANLTRFSPHAAYYANGVYRRGNVQSASHVGLYQSIIRAKERGQHHYFLGDLSWTEMSGIEKAIAHFKAGFATKFVALTRVRGRIDVFPI